jgi:hypothetical protein
MSTPFKIVGSFAIAATLTACGETDGERAATGAFIGGAVAAVTDENIVNGALIGGALGGTSCATVGNC